FVVNGFGGERASAEATAPAAIQPAPSALAASQPPRTPASAGGSAVLSGSRSGTSKARRSGELPPPGSDASARRRAALDRGEKKSRTIARFITDGPGDPLVKLGEDGHLPELMLHETQS